MGVPRKLLKFLDSCVTMNLQKESTHSKSGCSRGGFIYLSMRGAYPVFRQGRHYFFRLLFLLSRSRWKSKRFHKPLLFFHINHNLHCFIFFLVNCVISLFKFPESEPVGNQGFKFNFVGGYKVNSFYVIFLTVHSASEK